MTSTFFQDWEGGEATAASRNTSLGGPVSGVLAEYVILRERGVLPIAEHLSYEEAATLPCAAVTAWNALVSHGGIRAGDTVLAQGTGGVSMFALQFASISGARVIVTSSSDAKLERAASLGAWQGINYRSTPEWGRRAQDLTGGGVDHVVEVGGAKTFAQSLGAARIGGRISVIGVLTGATDELNIVPFLMKGLTVQGIFVGSREMFRAMNQALAMHQVRPVVDRVFPIEETRQALELMQAGGHFGKIVIQI